MSTRDPTSRAWVEVDRGALLANYRRLSRAAGGGAPVIPMVKADAYGIGARETVRTLEPEDPFAFGVATVDEGVALRDAGVGRRVVVFSPVPPGDEDRAVRARLTPVVSDVDALERLGRAVGDTPPDKLLEVHVEVDTGMGRSGFPDDRVEAWGPRVERMSELGLRWAGCFTHFHSADLGASTVREQIERFEGVLERLALPDGSDFLVHTANSAAALRGVPGTRAATRPGIFLYGGRAGRDLPAPEPVAAVRARVVTVRDVDAGATVGYGATYRASGPERWATLAVGYGDGIPRAWARPGAVLVDGVRVPIVGRISMDMTVINISDQPGVEAGDVATLVGRDGGEEITLDEVADAVGTIGYEILTGLTPRLPRVWSGGPLA